MTLVNFKLTQYSTGMYSVMATVVRCTLGGKRKSINKLGSYLWHQPKSIGRVFFNRVYYCNPLQYSCLESSMDRGAWWATVHGVTKSRTWLSDFHITSLYTVYECMYFKTAMKANFSVTTLTCKKEYIELIVIISQYIYISDIRWDPMDYILPGSSVHGILQAKILEWVAMRSSRGSSQPRDQTQVSHIAGRFFTSWATREAPIMLYVNWISIKLREMKKI